MPGSISRSLRSLASLCLFWIVFALPALLGEGNRTVKTRVNPVYPEVARRMNISGTVRLQVTVSADGSVKSIKPLGGHPLLIDSAVSAVKTWKYEKTNDQTTELVSINFSAPE